MELKFKTFVPEQELKRILPLVREGLTLEDIFARRRRLFQENVTDQEIRAVIESALFAFQRYRERLQEQATEAPADDPVIPSEVEEAPAAPDVDERIPEQDQSSAQQQQNNSEHAAAPKVKPKAKRSHGTNHSGTGAELDKTQLENIHQLNGCIKARCPACKEGGHDKSGDHLIIWANGKWGCVQHKGPEGRPHRQRIFALIGLKGYATLDEAIAGQEFELGMRATRRERYNDRFFKVRFDPEIGEKEFRPFSQNDQSRWVVKDPPGELPLFNLEELLARPTEDVHLVEGEKCVYRLEEFGVLATTSSHGAKSPYRTNWKPLAGRNVVIIPDNDEDGRAYARKIAGILVRLSPPANVRIVELPNLRPAEDIVEWLELLMAK